MTNRGITKPAGDAKWRVDRDLLAARERYPQNLPLTHIALLSGWEPKLGPVKGMLAGCMPEEFEQLSPLPRQLEVNRAHAKSLLVLDRAGQSELGEDDRERLTRRALGILPTEESARSGPLRVLAGIRSLMAEAQPGSDVPRRSPGAAESRAPSSQSRVISRPTDGID